MRRDICYFFPVDVISLYNAYLAVAQNDKFRRSCGQEPYHTLSFGLNFSMKYNFNGGACTLRFIPCQGGSAVNMRFSIAQAAGARYEKYANDLTDGVTAILGIAAQMVEINVEAFLADENKVFAQTAMPSTVQTPPPPMGKRCGNCQNPLGENDKFCSACGQAVAVSRRFCTNCGTEAADGSIYCSSCGNKL